MSHEYLMPEYYPDFACKMGACRAPCCEGWTVSLSMNEYFRLVGQPCPEPLRRELDVALRVLERREPDRYAEISHRYDGACRLHMADGRCALHAECGEAALPEVCRLYPRALRREGGYECSCAGSCEAVLERLWALDHPLRFIRKELDAEPPRQAGESPVAPARPREAEIRLRLIGAVLGESLPIPQRVARLAGEMRRLEASKTDDEFLCNPYSSSPLPLPPVSENRLASGLKAVERMTARLDQRSRSLRDYGEAANRYFGQGEGLLARYRAARAHFDQIAPKWQMWFANMLANHMFYSHFPFSDGGESLRDEALALCAVYTLLRFLGVGWMADKDDPASLVDVAAAAFRLIDHTPFHRYSASILRDLSLDTPEGLGSIVSL